MTVDIVSSLISIGAITTVMGLWMIAASLVRGEANTEQLRIWGLSCLVFGIAYALFASRDAIPLLWSLIVGNLFFALGYGGFGLAIAGLLERRFPFTVVLVGVLVCTAALYATEIARGDSSWRVLILAAVTIAPWTVSTLQCTAEWRRRPAPHILAMSLAFMAMILVSLSRVANAAVRGEFGYQGLPTGPGYLLGTHILLISPVLLTVGFFLLCAERTQETIRKLADTDPLTGILNRRSVLLVASNRLASARRRNEAFSCVAFDLDELKAFNDSFGHAAGDRAILHLTGLVAGAVRAEDLFGRLGGDEFVVFTPFADLDDAVALAERFRESTDREPLDLDGLPLTITASFGVASLQPDDESPLDLLHRADQALYEAKASGGNAVRPAGRGSGST